MKLTIGMASYNNYDETWCTVQTLRTYHDLADTEILVVDNFGDDRLEKFCTAWGTGTVRYVRDTVKHGTAYPRQRIFDLASGDWVLVIDSHVILEPDVIRRFKAWSMAHPDCSDLLQGPMLYDDHVSMADSMTDTWEGNMWGVWHVRHVNDEDDAYEIQMHGLGLFACRRDAWLGFNPDFRGFGGEEGYIHQKFRNAGHRTLCLPWLKWTHKFNTVDGVCAAPHSPHLSDVISNYETGFAEVGIDPTRMRAYFNVSGPQVTNIQIDPNAACGSKCWFCPVRYIERPAGRTMPQEQFEGILDGITEAIAAGSVAPNFTLWLSSYNDILFDPLIEQRLEALRARNMRFCCLTNGIGLLKHHALLDSYRDVIPCYSVDLPAGDADSYSTHTLNSPATFDVILAGLRALSAADPAHYAQAVHVGVNGAYDDDWCRRQLVYDLPIGDTDRQLAALRAAIPMYPRIEAMRPLCDRAGHLSAHAIDNGVNRPGTIGCNRLTDWIHVNSFGQVYACCQDYREEYKFGDLTIQSLDQVIRQRGSFREIKQDLCSKCTFSR